MTDAQQLRERFPDGHDWRYLGDGLWCADTDSPFRYRRFVLVDDARGAYASTIATGEPLPGLNTEVRRHLAAEIDHQLLPTCVVPDCQEKAPFVFKAAERGRLAGRDWAPGEEIRTCPGHGEDIFLAQGTYGRAELAEWLQPDAMLDPLDELDASHDVLHGHEIRESRARALIVKIPTGEQQS